MKRYRALRGTVTVPGDKSISHRALLLAALARGRSVVAGLNAGEDVRATAAAISRFGVTVTWSETKGQVEVESPGYDELGEPNDVLDCRNSGTTLRLLAGICAAVPGSHVLTGDASLRARPMGRIADPLRSMGASVAGRQGGRLPPLVISGGPLTGIDHSSPVASAQVKSALLLAGLRAQGRTSVTEPAQSRDHTEIMLRQSDVNVRTEGLTVEVEGGQQPQPRDWSVPGDPSAAMFLVVAALLTPGSELTIPGLCLSPTRVAAFDVLRDMGADLQTEVEGESAGGPVGRVVVRHSSLKAVTVGGPVVPSVIDEVPILAVAATQAEGTTRFEDVAELRVKESDRLSGLTGLLTGLGADVEETADSLAVTGPTELKGAAVDALGDHRMAMAAAVAASLADGDVRIKGWSAVDTSFPEFIDTFAAARGKR